MTIYRDFEIRPSLVSYHPGTDWTYSHVDYDGAEDAFDNRCGYAASEAACRAEIDDWYADQDEADEAASEALGAEDW